MIRQTNTSKFKKDGRHLSSEEQKCMKCSGTVFKLVTDAWMRRSIPWTAEGKVRQCEGCGEKHFVCPECRGLLTRVNITNLRVMSAKCPNCDCEDERIKAWLEEMKD